MAQHAGDGTPARRIDPPGPKGLPLVRNLLMLMRSPAKLIEEAARRYGDVVLLSRSPLKVFLLNHPDYVRDLLVTHSRSFIQGRVHRAMKLMLGEGLLTSEGDFHLSQRRLIQPVFHRKRIARYGDTMVRVVVAHVADWQEDALVDVGEEMTELTLKAVVKVLFNSEVSTEVRAVGDAMTVASKYLVSRGRNPLGRLLHCLPLPSRRRFERARKVLDGLIYHLIEERESGGIDGEDLLYMLLQARNDDDTRMSRQQVRDEAITLVAAGHETMANALTWTWYLLARHPEVEAALHREVDAVLDARLPTVEDLPRLPYTEQVFREALRLYPPIWCTTKTAIKPVEIGGYRIPEGSLVLISQLLIHRDARWFQDPLAFRPERWTPEFKASLPHHAYFPFGAGNRQCIGESFARVEGVLVIAAIAREWTLRLADAQPVEPDTLITLRPRRVMRMRLHRRMRRPIPTTIGGLIPSAGSSVSAQGDNIKRRCLEMGRPVSWNA